ncbi:Fusaric acid resistance protein-like-domain-containing protein [Pilobolus umbonatus]|nr:Fusaric acid resistance protein-like-domain-containing protein [Pilobolus umbonatus]
MSDPSDSRRLPRNAIPIPISSDAQYNTFDTVSPSFDALLYCSSPHASVFSEIDVVLDDGTLQKRTVSLSTLPEGSLYSEDEYGDNEHTYYNSTEELHINVGHETSPLLVKNENTSYSSIQHHEEDLSTTSNEDSDNSIHRYSKTPRSRWSTFSIGTYTQHLKCLFNLTPKQHLVLKCSFAYCLGSLFTFIPALNAIIGHNHVSSHLVATATVFFNPAKTLGGMVEAAMFGWGYTLFAVIVCLGSMFTTDFFIDRDMAIVAHSISLAFWLAGSTFIVSFLKAHWNKPPVATASSLCFIIIFIIVVREGSANKGDFDTTRIQQITSAVAMGTLVTVSCCILFWPVSASKKLRNDLKASLMSHKVLLKLLTKTFLLDDDLPEFKKNSSLQTAIESHRASFTSLQKSLQEAKLEVIWNDEIRGCTQEYDAVIKSMQRLTQCMGGLRSSCGIQFEQMKHEPKSNVKKFMRKSRAYKNTKETWNIRADHNRRKLEDGMRKELTHQVYSPLETDNSTSDQHGTLIEFIHTIRQPLKSLAYTCKQTIIHIEMGLSKSPTTSYETLKNNLVKAIALFQISERQAVKRLNRHYQMSNIEYVPQKDAFLAYFFMFNMVEFAKELISLVESVQALDLAKQKKIGVFTMLIQMYKNKSVPRKKFSINNSFIPNERHKMDTLHTPVPKTKWRQIVLRIWRTSSYFKSQKMLYATKATIACIMLAIPAFLSSTGPSFRAWRMEWALITLMVVMTPTVGGTNQVAIYRIFSTALGCCIAMCFYLIFPGQMYPLILLTWLFSIPNFWLILNHKHGKFGQFTLLAYNLVMLNKYNDRETDRFEVSHLALQRCLSIFAGVIFGLFVTAYIWPYEARVQLRKGVSDFLLRLGWLYQGLVSVYSERPSYLNYEGEELILAKEKERVKMHERAMAFMDVELSLQRSLLDLQTLLAQAPNEPRLKGSFPTDTYKNILISCQNITDKFASMRTVVLKDEWFDEVQGNIIIPANEERREVVGNVLLYFYILASALHLKTPLPPYLPPARSAWELLVVKLQHLPVVQSKKILEKDHVYLFYYVYITVLEDIIRELDKLGGNLTMLFGAILPEDRWNSLFDVGGDVENNSKPITIYQREDAI